MDGPQLDRQEPVLIRIWRGTRRWQRWTLAAVTVLVLGFGFPWFPYQPFCSGVWLYEEQPKGPKTRRSMPDWLVWDRRVNGLVIQGRMSREYAASITKSLIWWNVPTLRFGSTVLIPWHEWEFDDAMVNANNKSIHYAIFPSLEENPNWQRMPADLIARFLSMPPDERVSDDCELSRAVTMENWGRGAVE